MHNNMEIQKKFSLKRYNTFHIDAFAEYFAVFTTLDELQNLLLNHRSKRNEKLFILGGGSNILLSDLIEGLVLKNEIMGIDQIKNDADTVLVKARCRSRLASVCVILPGIREKILYTC